MCESLDEKQSISRSNVQWSSIWIYCYRKCALLYHARAEHIILKYAGTYGVWNNCGTDENVCIVAEETFWTDEMITNRRKDTLQQVELIQRESKDGGEVNGLSNLFQYLDGSGIWFVQGFSKSMKQVLSTGTN